MAGSYSYSRVGCFKQCPYKYKLRYNEGIEPYPNYDPQNALILGTALHTGVETGDIRKAIQEYYDFYPIITDTHVEEAIKLEVMIKKVREMIPNIDEAIFEYELVGDDGFHGFIDCLVPVAEHYWDMYDFKYASKSDRYKTSEQLELYRQMFERLNPTEKIVSMYFIVANKVTVKRHRDEDEDAYRRRINLALKDVRVDIVSPDAEISMGEFEETVEAMFDCTDFRQNKSPLCRWCEYEKYCSSDGTNLEDVMNLPENTRIGTNKDEHIRFWWYGLPYAGKTYLANKFPNVLMINSDGNTREVDAPRIHVTDVVNPSTSGRTVNKTLAWQVFKDVIEELAKKLGLDPKALRKTIDTYNGYVKAGKDPEFGRTALKGTFEKGPFYGFICKYVAMANLGGLKAGETLEILDVYGKPIRHLYAAGETLGGVHGDSYLSGNSIGACLTLGRVIGRKVAQNKA